MERTRSITRLLPLAAFLASTFVVAAVAPAGAVPSPDLVISEVYGAGGNSGAVLNADFVELFNRGDSARSLSGLSIQYASATGAGNFGGMSNQLVELPPVDVPPGGSFLVGMTPGTTGAALPTPDATGNIAMAAGAGKVALVSGTVTLGCNGGSAPCATDQLARIIDLVGYGNANFFEGTAAPTISPTTSAQRAANGCTDTDVNGADFVAAAPAAQTSASPAQPCGGGGPAVPVATCPAALAAEAGQPTSADVSASDADSAIASIELTSAPVAGITLTGTGAGTARLDVAGDTAAGVYDVTIRFATDDDPAQETSCTIRVSVLVGTLISQVQGSAAVSPMLGQEVLVQAIVTSLYTTDDKISGFFLQEEDADADADAATSEGISVDCAAACPAGLFTGDLVAVAGLVVEDFAMTQLAATSPGEVRVLSPGNVLPTATIVEFPASGRTDRAATFEAIEGMITTFSDELVVSEYFELARFGQIELAAGGRPYQFTHDHEPSAAGYTAFLAEQATRRIILDDDNDDQNDAISDGAHEPYPYPSPGLSTTNRFRGGDTITDLTGALEWSFGAWRVRPIGTEDYVFESENPAPAEPVDVGGDLRIASFNVLNYFTTIDTTASNDVGTCGPSGTLDCRGADSDAELVRQRAKIVAAMKAMDADIIGLIELQNDAGASVADLVAALNAEVGADTYTFIDTGEIGTDAIKVAFIYRRATVTPIGDFAVLDSSVDPTFIDTRNRPALIQTFAENATGERFTAAINHFKSKGSACTPDDPDLLDGQGNCSVTRTRAAEALARFLETDPTGSGDPDVIILGDLNSYRNEGPITALKSAGYTDLIGGFGGDDAYGYLFDGLLGYLDHALANEAMAGQVTGATEWHINADEVPLFDYNDDLRTTGEADFEEESDALEIDAADALRSSDHDPVVVGLDLSSLTVDDALIVQKRNGGGTLAMTADVDGTFKACPTLDLRVEGLAVFTGPTTRLGQSRTCISLTSKGLVTFDLQTGAVGAVLTLPSTFRLTDDTVTFALTVNGAAHVVDRPGRRIGLVWTTT